MGRWGHRYPLLRFFAAAPHICVLLPIRFTDINRRNPSLPFFSFHRRSLRRVPVVPPAFWVSAVSLGPSVQRGRPVPQVRNPNPPPLVKSLRPGDHFFPVNSLTLPVPGRSKGAKGSQGTGWVWGASWSNGFSPLQTPPSSSSLPSSLKMHSRLERFVPTCESIKAMLLLRGCWSKEGRGGGTKVEGTFVCLGCFLCSALPPESESLGCEIVRLHPLHTLCFECR
jgi:hypothetical protein